MSVTPIPSSAQPQWLQALVAAPTTAPEGAAPYSDRLEQLRALMAGLSAPEGPAVPWAQVADQAAQLLREVKDLKVVAYLLLAQGHLGGLHHIALGAASLAELVRSQWPTLMPPLSRLRGRLAALAWLHEEMGQLLAGLSPASAAAAAELKAAAESLDAALAACCDDPGMRFVQTLQRLPVAAPAALPLRPAAAQLHQPDAAPAAQNPSQAPSAVPPAVADLDALGAWLLQAADTALANDATHAGALRLRRQGLWLHITRAPAAPAPNGPPSSIPPLPAEAQQQLQTLEAQGRWAELFEHSEALMPRNRLQLRLQRLSAQALAHVGDAQGTACGGIVAETLALLVRLPALGEAQASDGSPLVDDATWAWLSRAAPKRWRPSTAPALPAAPQGAGQPHPATPRGQLLAQLHRAEAWQGPPEVAHAALYALSRRAHAGKLELWEPDVALRVFTAELQALSKLPPSSRRSARANRLIGRIAALDMGCAHSLASSLKAQGV